jgi:hypothetical protein
VTEAYTQYETAVRSVIELAAEKQTVEQEVLERSMAATAAAHDMPRQAVKQTESARGRVQQQQAEGRAALEAIGKEGLLPARVRPAKAVGTTTRTELEHLIILHASAVERLGKAVSAYEEAVHRDALRRQGEAQREATERSRRRAESEAERLRKEAEVRQASADSAARHRVMIRVAVAGVVALLCLVVVVVLLI